MRAVPSEEVPRREIHHLVYLRCFDREPEACAPTYDIAKKFIEQNGIDPTAATIVLRSTNAWPCECCGAVQ